jgi:hypothetical protein
LRRFFRGAIIMAKGGDAMRIVFLAAVFLMIAANPCSASEPGRLVFGELYSAPFLSTRAFFRGLNSHRKHSEQYWPKELLVWAGLQDWYLPSQPRRQVQFARRR